MNPVSNSGNNENPFDASSFVQRSIQSIKQQAGQENVICALSGGVDSSVTAALLDRAIGERLTAIFVDHGLLRKGEAKQISRTFNSFLRGKLITINARDRFFQKLQGITEPEKKRKVIGREFVNVFKEQAPIGEESGFLAQGTIRSDVVESGQGVESRIKSHHNVGGLPKELGFKLLEPIRELYKDQVRLVGKELGLASELIERQPFPGPGLAVRIIGEVTKEKAELLQEADAIVCREIEQSRCEPPVWQYFAVLPGINAVGTKSGRRVYGPVVAVRAVISTDGMNARWAPLPHDLLERISTRLTTEIPSVTRVVYDITSKPPGTIEWE